MIPQVGSYIGGAWITIDGVQYFFKYGQKVLVAFPAAAPNVLTTATIKVFGRDIGAKLYGTAAGGAGYGGDGAGAGGGGGAFHRAGLAIVLAVGHTYLAQIPSVSGAVGGAAKFTDQTTAAVLLHLGGGVYGSNGASAGPGGVVIVGAGAVNGPNGGGGSFGLGNGGSSVGTGGGGGGAEEGSGGAGGGNGVSNGAAGGGPNAPGGVSSGGPGGSTDMGGGGGGGGGGGLLFGVSGERAFGYGGGGGGTGRGGFSGGWGGPGAMWIEFVS